MTLPRANELPLPHYRTERERLAAVIIDMVASLTYYDRKGDEELPVGAIERMVRNGEVTIAEIVELFAAMLDFVIGVR